jgi:hypothetical protein
MEKRVGVDDVHDFFWHSRLFMMFQFQNQKQRQQKSYMKEEKKGKKLQIKRKIK